jgi:hypothetical protein
MAKDRKKLQHMHSSIPDKQPTPASLEVGEIAVNNSAEQEFLSVKNTNNKVVRFSSDGQIIEWIERKEVMPYKGYVRGEGGPTTTSGDTPTSDDKGSYGVTNKNLLENKSQLVFKLNQVAADLTTKHDKVNGADDMFGEEINPTDDYGVNDGAGFFIDMSRYAMIDANPSFSALTATCQTTLSGNTFIRDGASANTYGTDTGHTLDIKVTNNVVSGVTWDETLSAKTENISGRTTTIGNDGENLHVIGKTVEVHDGDVTITNKSNVTDNTSGATVENHNGTTTINNTGKTTVNVVHGTEINSCEGISANTNIFIVKQCSGERGKAEFDFCNKFAVNSSDVDITQCGDNGSITITEETVEINAEDTTINDSGDTTINTTGDTTLITSGSTTIKTEDGTTIQTTAGDTNINTTGDTNITSTSGICVVADKTAAFVGTVKTNIGKDCSDGGQTDVLNINGDTINITGGTMSAYTSGKTCVVANTDLNLGGNTNTRIGSDCAGNPFSDNVYVSATTLTEVKSPTITLSGNTTNITGATNVNIKGNDICISGGTEASMGANAVKVGTNCDGTTIAAGISAFSTNNVTITSQTINESGTSTVNIYGGDNVNVNSKDVCIIGTNEASMGAQTVNVGTDCGGSMIATTINISGTTINEGGTTNNNTFTTVNNTATTINNSTTTYNITGTSNVNVYGGDVCISGGTDASLGAKTVKIGTDCGNNTIASGITINATSSVTVNAPTTIVTGDTYISGDTIIGGDSFISGDTTVDGDLIIKIPCDSISSTTVNGALCEIMDRGVITMTRDSDPEDTRLAAVYKLFQNGEQIGYDINVPKDGFLKSVELVPVENVFYLRFTWYVYDADTKTYTTASTDVNVEDLVKDIEANNTKTTNRGATVDVWYNTTTKKMNVSADTVINLVTAANAGSERKNGQHYLSASTLTFSGGIFSPGTHNAFGNGKTINIPTSTDDITNNLKYLKWSLGTPSADTTGYNGSASKTITIPSTPSDIGMKDLKFTTGDTNVSESPYNGSAEKTITIPRKVSNLTNDLSELTMETGNTYVSGSPYNGGSTAKIVVPASVDNLTNYTSYSDGAIHLPHNVVVTGRVEASNGFFQTSDERKKDNIKNIEFNDFNKVKNVMPKSFTFKDDETHRKVYGAIAQEIEGVGLGELVYTDQDGYKSVDYTSLLMLKIAYLESYCDTLNLRITELENKINGNN